MTANNRMKYKGLITGILILLAMVVSNWFTNQSIVWWRDPNVHGTKRWLFLSVFSFLNFGLLNKTQLPNNEYANYITILWCSLYLIWALKQSERPRLTFKLIFIGMVVTGLTMISFDEVHTTPKIEK